MTGPAGNRMMAGPGTAPSVSSGRTPGPSNYDQRLDRLEASVHALIQEVKELRRQASAPRPAPEPSPGKKRKSRKKEKEDREEIFDALAKLFAIPGLVGAGNRFRSFMALLSNRVGSMWFRKQFAVCPEKFVVLKGHPAVPKAFAPAVGLKLKGSRTKPVFAAIRPVTGSATPAVTGRVVAGSRMVPVAIVRPRSSVLVAD